MLQNTIYTYEWFLAKIDTNFILVTNYCTFQICMVSNKIRYQDIKQWTGYYLCVDENDAGESWAGTCPPLPQCVMPSNKAIWIYSQFRERTDLIPDFCSDFAMVFHWLKSFSITLVFILAHLSFWHRMFRTLLNIVNYRYKTREKNIVEFYLLIQKCPIIQLAKLQIDILNWNTSFRHCQKILINLEKGYKKGSETSIMMGW